jgi:hypothetical protein
VLLEAIPQATERYPKQLGGLRTDAARSFQGLKEQATFHLAEHLVQVAAFLGQPD